MNGGTGRSQTCGRPPSFLTYGHLSSLSLLSSFHSHPLCGRRRRHEPGSSFGLDEQPSSSSSLGRPPDRSHGLAAADAALSQSVEGGRADIQRPRDEEFCPPSPNPREIIHTPDPQPFQHATSTTPLHTSLSSLKGNEIPLEEGAALLPQKYWGLIKEVTSVGWRGCEARRSLLPIVRPRSTT